jgi:hypothetical protein
MTKRLAELHYMINTIAVHPVPGFERRTLRKKNGTRLAHGARSPTAISPLPKPRWMEG